MTDKEKQIGILLIEYYNDMNKLDNSSDPEKEGKKAKLLTMAINDINNVFSK